MEPTNAVNSHNAKLISHNDRKNIALKVISNQKTITNVADENNVSRKFVHGLKNTALGAIDQSFLPESKNDNPVLFNLPVTKSWLKQFSLSLALNWRWSTLWTQSCVSTNSLRCRSFSHHKKID